MSELNKSVPYLRATLKEALLDLNDRPSVPKSAVEIVRDSRVIEAVLLILDRLDALEKGRG
jgi:hypothetical protein